MSFKNCFIEETKPRRVIILGNGFVGNHLYEKLINEQIRALVIGRTEIDLTEEDSKKRLSELLHPSDVVIFTSTITPSKGKGIKPFIDNIKIAQTVYSAVEAANVSHLIYLSSDAVYPLNGEVISEKTLAAPEDLYGVMHLAREYMLKNISTCPLAILRSSLIYGYADPHNSYGPNRLRRMALNEKKIRLFGEGKDKRDHVFINDIISLLLLVILYRSEGILNIASGHSISYEELAKKISDLYENNISIESSEQKNKIIHRNFDVSALHETFPFFSFTSIEEGLKLVYLEEKKHFAFKN